jgi:hypothetical protein
MVIMWHATTGQQQLLFVQSSSLIICTLKSLEQDIIILSSFVNFVTTEIYFY